jgi:Flp pilus assembly protein TadB
MIGVLGACLVAGGAALAWPRSTVPIRGSTTGAVAGAVVEGAEQATLARLRVPLSVLAALAGWTVIGGTAGVLVGGVSGAAAWRVLNAVEAPEVARRRQEVQRDLPMAIHLLGAALSSGSTTARALVAVADALPGPVAEEFRLTHHRLTLGLDPVEVWRSLDGPFAPLGRSMARAHESGASVVAAVDQVADRLRAEVRLRRDALARSVEVRAAAPLGLCFLPAFLLIGVVPMVVGIFSSVSLFS